MKCSLCGSTMKNGVCTFCGMTSQEESSEDGFDKHSVMKELMDLIKEETSESVSESDISAAPVRHMYEEHYERRHIHNESEKGGVVSSLTVKVIILILLLMVMFFMFTTDEKGQEAPPDTSMVAEEEENKFVSDFKCKGLITGEEYIAKAVVVDTETSDPILLDGAPITAETSFIAVKEEMEVEISFETDLTNLEVNKFVIFTSVYKNEELISLYETVYLLNGKVHITL